MGPTDPANCCCDEDGGGDPICRPFGWINPCSIGWYVSDRCETPYTFQIKKDGVVIVGPSVAKSYSLTPPFGEVATYTIEVCEGTIEPCAWSILIGPTEVDTTDEDACPMGLYGQTYVIGIRPSDNELMPSALFLYCQSSLIIRASALAAPGQVITHLWIDDVLFTPNTNYVGGIATEGGGDPLSISFMCHSGKAYGHADISWNDSTLTQIRLPLPIPFTKGSFSIRARQTNGMIIGCTVECTCTAHYNAASVTLPSWSGMSFSCSADGGMPPRFMGTPVPMTAWCQHFEASLNIVPTSATGGTFSWITCQTLPSPSMVVGTFACTYNFKCNGQIRWIDPSDTVPRPIYSGTYSFDHTVTWDMNLVLGASFSPGALTVGGIDAVIAGDVTSTITGHNDWPAALQASLGAINWLGTPGLNDVYSGYNHYGQPDWFAAELFNNLGCGPPPYDGDSFQWKWIGPRFPTAYWTVIAAEFGGFPIVPSPVGGGNLGTGSSYLNATWPAGTNFNCELSEDSPYGGYYEVTESAYATQYQV